MRARMKKEGKGSVYRVVFYVLLGIGVLACCLAFCTTGADAPAGRVYDAVLPKEETPDALLPCMLPLRAEQLTRIPTADGFQWPVGAPGLAFMYDAQGFGVHNEKRGGFHSGQDLNGIGGQNTDLGTPVRAAARGLVVYCGTPSAGWGKVVVVAHRLPGDETVYQTLYAHLDAVKVRTGDTVYRGDEIGTMGTAEGQYWAHLHFEVIASRMVEAGITAYHPGDTMNRINPAAFIAKHPAPLFPDPMSDVVSYYEFTKSFNTSQP